MTEKNSSFGKAKPGKHKWVRFDDRLHLQAAIHLDFLPIPLAAVDIDFQCHQDWIDFTSIPMGIDKIMSLKVGNKLGLLPIALAFDEIDI